MTTSCAGVGYWAHFFLYFALYSTGFRHAPARSIDMLMVAHLDPWRKIFNREFASHQSHRIPIQKGYFLLNITDYSTTKTLSFSLPYIVVLQSQA
ncbi:MAG: hypothetical protein AB2613_17410, partial [Candidatus Thiodiazotropha taylori]